MKKINDKNINTIPYWDNIYQKHLESEVWEKDIFKFKNIAGHIEKRECMIVDLGCGTGELVQVIHDERPEALLIGVDFAEEAIKRAEVLQGQNVDFLRADVTKTGLTPNNFDYVVTSEVLEHLEEPKKLIEEAARLLKPGGKLILTTPFQNHIPSEEHIWSFDYYDVKQMLALYFKDFWVFPWASGRSEVREAESGKLVYPCGDWDTIMALAVK